MHVVGLVALLALSQAESPAPAAAPAPAATTPEEREAAAAEKTADALARLADVLAPKPAVMIPAAKTPEGWLGSIGFGLSFLTGNAQQLTLTGTLTADRKWEKWALGLRANGAYGLSNPAANVAGTESQLTARRAGATVRGDRAFGGFATLFALGGLEFDHLKNVETRTIGELGTGLTFFDLKEPDFEKLYLRLDLAMRAGYETRFQYLPVIAAIDPYAIVILAPRAAITFRWSLNKHVRLTEELELIPFLLAPTAGRLLINDTTKLSARLTDNVSLTVAVLVQSDSKPPPSPTPRVPTDVALTVGVDATF